MIILYVFIIIFIFYYINYHILKKYNNNIDFFSNYNKNNKERYTAIIVEPREHKALEFVLNNFVENLSENWDFIIFHGNKNIDYLLNTLKSPLLSKNINRIKLINLNVDNLSIRDYNNLLVSKDFYDNIPTEVFLIFQTDSIICKEYKDLINDFIKYDYVGAPLKAKLVGNGGLSLRRKSKMLEIIKNCEYKNEPEDVYFSVSCSNVDINKPSYEKSKEFGVEAVYHPNSFGVHKLWRFLNDKEMNDKNKFCSGVFTLSELNKK
jgi:hypothetical protein